MGRRRPPPIALAEVQGYVYDAKRRMARLAAVRGETDLAIRLDAEADQLATRFEQAFWMEDRRYYAIALDRDKRQADAIASNAGQCLWTGIVTPDRARDVMDRILRPEMFSGWGVRTLASGQPGYNPIGYHTGTVWPHDTSLIAAGFKRYGFDDATNRLVGQMMEAARDSRITAFPSCSAVSTGPMPTHRSPIRWRARRKRGPPVRRSSSWRPCSACGRTPTATSWSFCTRTCRSGSARSP